tara:strand:- start:14 stop:4036 length:4023 start_codon:yes stop_codon:yes gene_type:complete
MKKNDEYYSKPSENQNYPAWQKSASSAYTDPSKRTNIGDYIYNTDFSDTENAVYVNSTGDVLFAARGTANVGDATSTWGQIVTSQLKTTDRYKREVELAEDVIQEYPNANITFTGHSLGGTIATLLAGKFKANVVAYNPGTSIVNELDGKPNSMITYKTYMDPVSNARTENGTTYYLTSNSWNKHGIDSLSTDQITGEYTNRDDAKKFFDNPAGNGSILGPGNPVFEKLIESAKNKITAAAKAKFNLNAEEVKSLEALYKLDGSESAASALTSMRQRALDFMKNKIGSNQEGSNRLEDFDDSISDDINVSADEVGLELNIQAETPIELPRSIKFANNIMANLDSVSAQIHIGATQASELVQINRMKTAINNGKSLTEYLQLEDKGDLNENGTIDSERIRNGSEVVDFWKKANGILTEPELDYLASKPGMNAGDAFKAYEPSTLDSFAEMDFSDFTQTVSNEFDRIRAQSTSAIKGSSYEFKTKAINALDGVYDGLQGAIGIPAIGFAISAAITGALDKALLDPMKHVDEEAYRYTHNAIMSSSSGISITAVDKLHGVAKNAIASKLGKLKPSMNAEQIAKLKDVTRSIDGIESSIKQGVKSGATVAEEAAQGVEAVAERIVSSGVSVAAIATASSVASITAGLFAGIATQEAVTTGRLAALAEMDPTGRTFDHESEANVEGAVVGGFVGGLATSAVGTGIAVATGTGAVTATLAAEGALAAGLGAAGTALMASGAGAALGLLIAGAAVLIALFDGTSEISDQSDEMDGWNYANDKDSLLEIAAAFKQKRRADRSDKTIARFDSTKADKNTTAIEVIRALNYEFYIDTEGKFHPFPHYSENNHIMLNAHNHQYDFHLAASVSQPEDVPTSYGGAMWVFLKYCREYIESDDWVWLYNVLQEGLKVVEGGERDNSYGSKAIYEDYHKHSQHKGHTLNDYQNKRGGYKKWAKMEENEAKVNLANWQIIHHPIIYYNAGQDKFIQDLLDERAGWLNGEGESKGIDPYNYSSYLHDTNADRSAMRDDIAELSKTANKRLQKEVMRLIDCYYTNRPVDVYVSQLNRHALRFHPLLSKYKFGECMYIDAPMPKSSKERYKKEPFNYSTDPQTAKDYHGIKAHVMRSHYMDRNEFYERNHVPMNLLNKLIDFGLSNSASNPYKNEGTKGAIKWNMQLLLANAHMILSGDENVPFVLPDPIEDKVVEKVKPTSLDEHIKDTEIVVSQKGGAQETVYRNGIHKKTNTRINPKSEAEMVDAVGKMKIDQDAILNKAISNKRAYDQMVNFGESVKSDTTKRMKTEYGQSVGDVLTEKTNIGAAMEKAKAFNEDVQTRFANAGDEMDRVLNRDP